MTRTILRKQFCKQTVVFCFLNRFLKIEVLINLRLTRNYWSQVLLIITDILYASTSSLSYFRSRTECSYYGDHLFLVIHVNIILWHNAYGVALIPIELHKIRAFKKTFLHNCRCIENSLFSNITKLRQTILYCETIFILNLFWTWLPSLIMISKYLYFHWISKVYEEKYS